jgi:hypothetical protein
MNGTLNIAPSPDRRGHWKIISSMWVPYDLNRVFDFFANAENLERLTPPWLRFQIKGDVSTAMSEGTLIDYKLRVHGVPISWRSKITKWQPPYCFQDEQVIGPYQTWEHVHLFEESGNGTHIIDKVTYRPTGGALVNWLLVKRDLNRIFRYRQEQLADVFPSSEAQPECALVLNGAVTL